MTTGPKPPAEVTIDPSVVLATPCGETNVTCGNPSKRFDHELFLSCPHTSLEIVDGVIPEDRNSALTHDRAGVVLGIDKMNRNTRFRFTGFEHRLEHPRSPYIPRPPNLGKSAG
jgi:hypothetical protein